MAIDLLKIGSFTIHGYGLMIGFGFLAAILIACYRARKVGLNDDFIFNMAIFTLVFGWMGGKLLFIIVEFKNFLSNPLGILGSSGFVVYGGIISGILTIFIYSKIKKINFFDYIDIIAPSVSVNQAFGRVGCFMAGCCYGRVTDSKIGVIFPENSLAPAGVRVLPTQLFSAVGDALIFFLLIMYAKRKPKKGMVTALYLMLYAVGRFLIEFLRDDDRGTVGILSTSQFISLIMFVVSIGLILFIQKKKGSGK